MTVNTLTLYMPGGSVGIQVYEGSQLHLILVSQGANSVQSAPGETVRDDPFPQYIDDEELAAALAGVGGGTSYSDDQAVDAVEAAATVSPAGAWDFTQTPTVGGQLLGTGGGGAVAPASEGTAGVVELATAGETYAGLDTTRAVTPARMADYVNAALATIPPNPDLSKVPTWIYQASAGTWAARSTVTTDTTRPVEWIGYPGRTDPPASAGTGAIPGVDFYRRRDTA